MGSPRDVSTFQGKLNNIPNLFVSSNLACSGHGASEPSGAKKWVQVSAKAFLVGAVKPKTPMGRNTF